MFKLESLDYREKFFNQLTGTTQWWEVGGLEFSDISIIAGLNASGKSRSCRVLANTLKYILSPQKVLQTGCVNITFHTNKKKYQLQTDIEEKDRGIKVINKDVLYEVLENRRKTLFNRKIILEYDGDKFQYQKYSPPDESLTVHARRDKSSYPYLEDVVSSIRYFHFLDFKDPSDFLVKVGAEGSSLPLVIMSNETSYIYQRIKDKYKNEKILGDLNNLGFPIRNIRLAYQIVNGVRTPVLVFKEYRVRGEYDFHNASAAQTKVVFLVLCMHLLEKGSCILIDNIGDGLDFKRSIGIVKYLEDNREGRQIILSTNNEILLNQTDIRNWNILFRRGSKVRAFNYINSKDKLEKFCESGLSNYEYFQDEYFLED